MVDAKIEMLCEGLYLETSHVWTAECGPYGVRFGTDGYTLITSCSFEEIHSGKALKLLIQRIHPKIPREVLLW